MIIDRETNYVYFSEYLAENRKYSPFYKRLINILDLNGIDHDLLPNTNSSENDIWCRDYMPIQVGNNEFVQFIYNPSYLNRTKKDRATITDPEPACIEIGVQPNPSEIRLDGGNVVRSETKAIITSRVYSENKSYPRSKLLEDLKRLLRVKKVIVIPECPDDEFGHADGLVRFINTAKGHDNTVFISNCVNVYPKYFANLYHTLTEEGLIPIPMPFSVTSNISMLDATGVYINFLRVGKKVVYPVFGIKEDETVRNIFCKYYGSSAIPLKSNEISKEGGVLNCITWTMWRKHEQRRSNIKFSKNR